MTVIINELEIITEAPAQLPTAAGDAAETTPPPPPPELSPEDIEAIERFHAERAARLYAG
jgi:hypothetical protein